MTRSHATECSAAGRICFASQRRYPVLHVSTAMTVHMTASNSNMCGLYCLRLVAGAGLRPMTFLGTLLGSVAASAHQLLRAMPTYDTRMLTAGRGTQAAECRPCMRAPVNIRVKLQSCSATRGKEVLLSTCVARCDHCTRQHSFLQLRCHGIRPQHTYAVNNLHPN